jgi:hypothetical protein
MRIFVCKLRLHFPDSKHLRGFIYHEIFGNFFRHLGIFGLHPPTIHVSYDPDADDLVILSKAKSGLQNSLNTLHSWGKKWLM